MVVVEGEVIMSNENKPVRYYVHSTHCKYKDDSARNAVVVKEEICKVVDGKEQWIPHLQIYRNPTREFYVTLPQYRNHQYKKEFESLDHLETFRCRDSDLHDAVARALGFSVWKTKYAPLKTLCVSPYIYGADIDTETLIKQAYLAKQPAGKSVKYTAGAFDIETEVVGEKRINVITFIHEHEVYTGALKAFCNNYDKEHDRFTPATKEDCLKVIDEIIGDELRKHQFNLHFEILDTELDLIKWIFARIHECKTDIIGIWNIGFDIPKILDRLTKLGVNPADVMCPLDLPKEFRYCKFSEDTKKAEHIADKWHWLNLTGYSQFIDSMCLYARIRKVDGRDVSYSLDYISNKELGQGKLHLGEITNHRYSQTYEFLKYIAYNINDVLIMQLMEWKNHDIGTMLGLSDCSLLKNFSKQTVMVRDGDYVYAKANGYIPASATLDMYTEWDGDMPKAGGTVLPPEKAVGVGINALKGINRTTQVSITTNDLDESSMYPSTLRAFNISKETYYGSVLGINGYDKSAIEVFGSALNQPNISAVHLFKTFFNMPDYDEMLKLYEEQSK